MTDTSINPDGTRTGIYVRPSKPVTKPKDEAWLSEAKRLNDLVVELTPKRQRDGREPREDDTPAEVLEVLLMQQERHLGGVAARSRGFLLGTQVAAHGRVPHGGVDPWKALQASAWTYYKQHGGTEDAPIYLENRAAKRKWAKLNPFRVKKVRLHTRRVEARV